ncbi:MAG TPA: DUF4166 domain-containing protein [Hyphomicrobiales bacterium]|nr:DUF4166 domain-containing protein [Hyphomicrobiales bacterium]
MNPIAVPVQEPIVKRALGRDWDAVPEILRRNFDLPPGSDAEVRLKGVMYEISYSRIGRLFIYPGQLFGALVPYQGKDIKIRIDLRTHASDPRFMYWQRVHFFPQSPEFIFSSRMEYLTGNEFVERVRSGLGMRMKASVAGGVLKFEGVCYQWDLWGLTIRLPNWLLMGKGVILERQVSTEQFEMLFEIHHPWWGRTFAYKGRFSFI